MDPLRLCPGCARHVKSTEDACPFCRSRVPFGREAAMGVVGALAVGVAITVGACGEPVSVYGPAPGGWGGSTTTSTTSSTTSTTSGSGGLGGEAGTSGGGEAGQAGGSGGAGGGG